MDLKYPEIGVCGLSCRLCPNFQSQAESKCAGCKSEGRMALGCPFITCAIKKRGVEFCCQCNDSAACGKWRKHREAGLKRDSFKCYQKLDSDIAFIEKFGVESFEGQQRIREALLKEMLEGFNEGRSKSFFCIAATVLEIDDLRDALQAAKMQSCTLPLKEKAKVMHAVLQQFAKQRGYLLKLRK